VQWQTALGQIGLFDKAVYAAEHQGNVQRVNLLLGIGVESSRGVGVRNCCEGKYVMGSIPKVVLIAASSGVFSMHADVISAESLTLSDIRTRCSEPDGSEEFAFCRGYIAALVEVVIVKRYSRKPATASMVPPMKNH
jgi:hypothetical protein